MKPFHAKRLSSLALIAVALAWGPARADSEAEAKKRAAGYYKQATTKYNLGRWDEAIELFQKSYEEFPAPEFLFNIAQAYRQKGDCQNGLFFYRRFLALKPDTAQRPEVEARIAELKENCNRTEETKGKPPYSPMGPGEDGRNGQKSGGGDGQRAGTGGAQGDTGSGAAPDGGGAAGTGTTGGGDTGGASGGGDAGAAVHARAPISRPTLLSSRAEIGVSNVGMGDLEFPGALLAVRVGAGYPIALGDLGVEAGAAITLNPLPWENAMGKVGTATMTGLLANGVVTYPLMDRLALRGELGLGLLLLSGLTEAGNVFVPPGKVASGALASFNTRVAVGAEYTLTSNLVLTATPLSFSFSPAHDGLRDDVSSIRRLDVMAGVGYRM
jgi:hypothetical protein